MKAGDSLKIIDYDKKGNVVKFYFAPNNLKDWNGDDWNDAPYDCNAGTVYDRFISGEYEIAVPYDWAVLEPSDGCWGNRDCRFCKDDMKARSVPCIIIVPQKVLRDSFYNDHFDRWVCHPDVIKIYFGDDISVLSPFIKLRMWRKKNAKV